MWCVYILRCKDNSLYTGISNDPRKRFEEHISGRGGKYTRSHRPEKIVHLEKFPDKSSALKREAEIKKMKKGGKERLISSSWGNFGV